MIMVDYVLCFIVVFVVLSVVVLGVAVAPHHGVIALMSVSFFCCTLMVVLGRTFTALVMYIVYLGGLVVVFSYCVSVEKGSGVEGTGGLKYPALVLGVGLVVCLWVICVYGGGGGLVLSEWEDYACLEAGGYGVFYFKGGAGLLVCSWGLIVALFSVLVVLSWSRLGGFRPF
uniref:NADH-ubiquinone oxidoreductase chain 6 n=1 Tax=Pareas stanleyi TaxID=1197907 RepID=A0A898NT37_9SAUR|nr:NADH dehydrogenase subunit 6 [Pareas stanleyi]QSJ54563.1 NADH dehydrogenase subunit 6 [Pareas stanleyi]